MTTTTCIGWAGHRAGADCRPCDRREQDTDDLQDRYDAMLARYGGESALLALEAIQAAGRHGQPAHGVRCEGRHNCTEVLPTEADRRLCDRCETDMWDAWHEQQAAGY